MKLFRTILFACCLASAGMFQGNAQSAPDSPDRKLARDIFQQLIEINTTDSAGSTTDAAKAMAARLKAAGFAPSDARVLGPNPRKGNLVARLRGSGTRKAILLLAHLDVVEARRARGSDHVDGRHRWPGHTPGGHSNLWGLGLV